MIADCQPTAAPMLAVDGNSLAYRAYYALPPSIVDPAGHPINAAYGFLSMLGRLIVDHRPRGVLVAFDSAWPTLRHQTHPEYKGNRQQLPEALLSQVPVLRSLLTGLRVTHVALSGYEADDIVATAASHFARQSIPTLIVTGDRDLFQVVRDPLVRVLYTRQGVKHQQVLDEASVESLVGVRPSRYVEFAALRGDVSDNIPGVPGVGEKTAVRLVNSVTSFDELLNGAPGLTLKDAQILAGHADTLRRNYDLMRVDTEVPLDWSSLDLGLNPPQDVPDEFSALGLAELFSTLWRAVASKSGPPSLSSESFVTESRRARICLVSCAADKLSTPVKAKDLYTSPLFRKSRAWAEMVGDEWFILSALHGLLDPERVTAPYDKNLNDATPPEKNAWAQQVAHDLRALANSQELTFILGGQSYSRILAPLLTESGLRVATPLAGMSIGQRLQWLNAQLQVGKAAGDLEEFYAILEWLGEQTGSPRRLDSADRSPWPERGVYFFFESTENRLSSTRLRVTRVGTHAVSANSQATLWNRLRTHRGVSEGGGNHRSSIFRSHLGTALLHQQGRAAAFPYWGNQAADQAIARPAEIEIERAVSAVIGQMLVTAIDVPDDVGPKSDRAFIERNAIALLARVGMAVDLPSDAWLGRWSPHPAIKRSGLWNVNYVAEVEWHPRFLEILDYYARVTAGKTSRARGSVAPFGWWSRRAPAAQAAFDWNDTPDP